MLALFAAGQCAATAYAATVNVGVNATALKALQIVKLQDLDLGTITLGPGTWSNASVSLTQLGVFVCVPLNITCSGATQVARYNVQGSNKGVVQISTPNVTLVNQGDASKTLTLVVDSPPAVILPNSGQPGVDFSIGGTITVNSTTASGTYVGTFNVTADYQ
jgi:hypothetical protein